MNPLYQKWAMSLVRALLKAGAALLIRKGWAQDGFVDANTLEGAAVFVVAQAWSWYEQHGDMVLQLVTQTLQRPVTRAEAVAIVKQSVALPSAKTPADVLPPPPVVAPDPPKPSSWPVPPAAALLLVLLLPGVAHAQVGTEPMAWQPSNRPIADAISTWAVAGTAGAAAVVAVRDWRDGNHRTAWRTLCSGGIAVGASEGLKALIHEPRPNGIDTKSFPSEHSAISAALSGWSFTFGVPLAIGVGMLRIDADWHHPKDVAAGWGIGAASQWGCSKLVR